MVEKNTLVAENIELGMLSPPDIGRKLSIVREQAHKLINDGSIIAVDVSAASSKQRCWRVRRADFEAFLESRSNQAIAD